MKRIRPFRLVVLVVATLSAGMLWAPAVAAIVLSPLLLVDPYLLMGRIWWSIQLLCSVLTFALTAVAVMRRDFVSIFGFASVLSVYFGAQIFLMAIVRVF